MRFMKHSNVAIFVPHNGCPHQCTFCNQREITGQAYQPDENDVKSAAETAIRFLGEKTKNAEIAFFGGSFTAIDRKYMLRLLDAAYPFIKDNTFYGIRLSTRPDAVDDEVLSILKGYGVTSIELGAQSMDDHVLLMNKRGHTAAYVSAASEKIRSYGFSLGLQMMTGLYGSTPETDKKTAELLAALKPDTVRIYPTVVLNGTELADLYRSGMYKPLSLDDTVILCAGLIRFFEQKNINVIRVGLHDSDSLRENMVSGVFHPALRELCESRIMFENTIEALHEKKIVSGKVEFTINPKSLSRFIGQKKCNIDDLYKKGIIAVVRQDAALGKYDIIINDTPLS